MALATFPSVSSPVKSVQRGVAAGAGSVTITAIDISKSMVNVFGTASSGTVSASFGMSMNAGSMATLITNARYAGNNSQSQRVPGGSNVSGTYQGVGIAASPFANFSATVNAGNAVVNAGTNNLVAAVVQGFLANSTTLTVSGACRFEIVEFN